MEPKKIAEHNQIYCSDALSFTRSLPDNSVQCIITSPPYYQLRSYLPDGHDNKDIELGNENSPREYIDKLVEIFHEARRVLRNDGVLFLNAGDTFARNAGNDATKESNTGIKTKHTGKPSQYRSNKKHVPPTGFKPKDLMLIPSRLAIALQDDGWWVRNEIIWDKKSPLPESVKDRFTRSHEQIYLLTKSAEYWMDMNEVREFSSDNSHGGGLAHNLRYTSQSGRNDGNSAMGIITNYRNRRDVWRINSEKTHWEYCKHCGALFEGSQRKLIKTYTDKNTQEQKRICTCGKDDGWVGHYAVFPTELVKICMLAGCPKKVCPECHKPWNRQIEKEFVPQTDVSIERVAYRGRMADENHWKGFPRGTVQTKTLGWNPACDCNVDYSVSGLVFDPFIGSGTVALVAQALGMDYLGCDLNGDYVMAGRARLDQPHNLSLGI